MSDDAAIRRFLDVNKDALVRLARDMVRTNSVTVGESELARLCATWFEEHGIAARLWPAKGRFNVTGAVGATTKEARTLVISGHLDTVPCDAEAWTMDPFAGVVQDNRLYGLGASDMKASLACACFALKFLQESASSVGRVVAAFTIEEETTGDGTRLFLEDALRERFLDPGATAAVVTEPTGLREIALGNKGTVFAVLRVEGSGGHGSRPHLAKNPIGLLNEIVAALPVFTASLERYRDEHLGGATITPTSVTAGDARAVNVIPPHAQAILDCRVPPALFADGFAQLHAEIDRFLAAFRRDGFAIAWEPRHPRAGATLPATHPLAQAAMAVLREEMQQKDARFAWIPSGNDAVFFAAHGIPVINKVGPGLPEVVHRPDEYVPLENLVRGTEFFIRLATRWSGPGRARV